MLERFPSHEAAAEALTGQAENDRYGEVPLGVECAWPALEAALLEDPH